MIQSFSYELIDKVLVNFKTFNYNLIQTPNGASSVTVKGTLDLVQKEPFALGAIKRYVGYDDSFTLYKKLQVMQMVDFVYQLN